jgi:hypothetical protein
MKRLLKSNPEYSTLVASSPIHYSVRDYGLFLSHEEWRNIPIINQQPVAGDGQYLSIIIVEVDGQLRRQWMVETFFEEVTE